ncbi:outer membrane beta-barrel family protein [Rufibacter roseus]|uniref:Outer membrane beta-barrel protein n=1 Tax=Rufibacter roseus TaxID=1567108 RepID=A0ABW2DLW1_9BACT|nr:outer membrane beta-barrel family protein [Rufibacter roseus]
MKKRALFLLGLLCLCLFFSMGSWAQTNSPAPAEAPSNAGGTISGTLTDSISGKPVEFATVALLKSGNTTAVAGTMTDAQGKFYFQNVPFGTYIMSFSFIGYKSKTSQAFSLTPSKPNVKLGNVSFAQASTNLDEVTVTNLRPTITQEADKMVVSIEGTALASGRTAFDVLSRAPGVFVDQDGNIQLNGRGGVTVMLDGKLTYMSASDIRNLLQSMSAENIKYIEIISTPSAKFDAEGASGILNINLKKNELYGMNGSVFTTGTYNFKQWAGTVGGNVNYKAGKWNSFLSLEHLKRAYNRDGTFTRVFYDGKEATYYDQTAYGKSKNLGPPNFRVGTDYSLTDKHSVGAMVYFNQNKRWENFNTATYIGDQPQLPEQYITANNFVVNTFRNFTSNLHYVGKLDTLGTTLSADIDFVNISNWGYSNFYNYFGAVGAAQPARTDFLYADSENGFDIYSGKIDFAKTFSKLGKVELGLKASHVVSDNDSRFFFNNDALVLDPRRTNHFLFTENIYAGYVNWNRKFGENFTLQAGLRAENTVNKGELLTTGAENSRNYLNLFPSLFVQQKVNDNYQISYSYSRRIQRPNYGHLNPFVIYRDPYTYWEGNPYLQPQLTNAIGITQTFKKNYSLVLNFQQLQNVISELPRIVPEDTLTVYYMGNVDDSKNFSLSAIAPVKITKKWDTNNTFTVSYNEFRMMVTEGQRLVNKNVLYTFQTNQNILLPKDFMLEVNGVVRSRGVSGLYVIQPMWWVHLGVRKSFMNKKLDVNLNVNDVFRTYRLRFDTSLGRNVNNFDQYFFSQNIGITLRYHFSRGQKFDPKRRNNNLEELNRT